MDVKVSKMVKKINIWSIIVTVLVAIITGVAVMFMPESVPMHYDAMGEVDRFGSRYENFIMVGAIFLTALFFLGFELFYGKKGTTEKEEKKRVEALNNCKIIAIVGLATIVFFTLMQCVILYKCFAAMGMYELADVDMNSFVNVFIGVLFVVIGNIMPKAKRNSTFGLRIPSSMYNDKTWRLSNAFAGKVFVVCGILVIICSIFLRGFASTGVVIVLLLLAMAVSCVYAICVCSKIKEEEGDYRE